PEQVADGLQLVVGVVEGDDAPTSPQRLEGVTPGAGSHVEDQLSRRQAEIFVVDGEHARWISALGQECPVVLDGADSSMSPAPSRKDALAAGCADALRAGDVVEGPSDAGRERLAV